MQTKDFHYELPTELIAQYPTKERTASRLLVLEQGNITHSHFSQFLDVVEEGDLLVFNNTKVIPARLYGHKTTGGKIEILVERVLGNDRCLAQIKASKGPKPGSLIYLARDVALTVVSRENNLYVLCCTTDLTISSILAEQGHMPLPPYITRTDEAGDQERYQTVYAKEQGAVAAPTAGLHFDEPMLQALNHKGVNSAFVTLHVGAGTFTPVRVDNIEEHHMHAEFIEVNNDVCDLVAATKKAGKRVIAVGTTSVRCLETASQTGELKPYHGDTDIFIYPGFKFQTVDAMLTNFHLPESTLLMLVSAFAGSESIKAAYQAAIDEQYRFFSYGDAMFLTRVSEV